LSCSQILDAGDKLPTVTNALAYYNAVEIAMLKKFCITGAWRFKFSEIFVFSKLKFLESRKLQNFLKTSRDDCDTCGGALL
jgi:hypothetical protein